ncbi:MFS transporter [Streptomyces longispororuber]|uniref:MFS transporter n=1 Tax=Streptomyces longispororuber TaxID=68230 RepID=UPI00210CC2DA|nr:MFS transporter [Streptomyces longispororuber]MCQ4212579.1 MFS transporter [Streptomyces longispororuber]
MTQLVLVLDATIVNVALPKAQIELGMTDTERQWVVTAYVLAFGSLLLLGGRLADFWGRKRSFLIGMIGFGAASIWGGLSQTSIELISARGIQGAFAALLAPAALSMLTVLFTSGKERARAFGIFGIAAGSAATIGLALGGALTEFVGWRWCLLVNIVFAVLGVLGAVLFMRESKANDHHGQDLWGAIVVTLGFASLVYGLTLAQSGWASVGTIAFLVLGAILIAVFFVIESKTRYPLLPLRVLRNRTRAGAFIVQAVVGAVYIGATMFQAFHLQAVLGFSPLLAGVASLPMAITTMALAPLATRLFERFGARYVMAAGLLIAAVGMFYLTQLTVGGSYWVQVFPGLLLIGIGLAFVVVPVQNVGLADVPWSDAGAASAVMGSSMQLGGSIALAVFTTLFVEIGGGYASGSVAGYAAVYLAAGIVLVVGAIVSAVLVRRAPDAGNGEWSGENSGEWSHETASDWSQSSSSTEASASSEW